MTSLRRAALDYAARGWHVFPCHSIRDGRCTCRRRKCDSPGKHPLTAHGKDDATTDPEQIVRWWERWPWANVAIAAGATSGLAVLDVDGDHGHDSIVQLQCRHEQLPQTLWARTGSGGWHCYLRHPGREVHNSSSKLAPGIDVRGDGGYVLAPPSLHLSGERYHWHNPESEPAPIPRWLLSALDPPRRVSAWSFLRDRAPVPERLEALVRFVASLPVGRRNDGLFWASMRALEEGHPPDEAAAHLLEGARACGLAEREALRTIRSALTRTPR